MALEKTILSVSEKIDRAMDGRSQRWLVGKLNELGIKISEAKFSNKKTGRIDSFTKNELKVISKLLGVKI